MSVLPTTRLRTSRLVVEPAASRHVHPMETGFPIAVAAAAAAAPWRVGGSAMPVAAAPGGELLRLGGGNGVVPSATPRPPRAGVLVLFPRRRRRARLPDRIRPLNPAIGRTKPYVFISSRRHRIEDQSNNGKILHGRWRP